MQSLTIDLTMKTHLLSLIRPTSWPLFPLLVWSLTLTAKAQTDATVEFATASSTVIEGGTFSIQVNLSNPLSYNLTVYAGRIDGTAIGADFFNCGGPCVENQRSVTIPAGSTSGMMMVPTYDDSLDEDPESCTLRIENTSQGSSIGFGAQRVHTLNLTDNDGPPEVAFASTTSSSFENVGTHQIEVRLSQLSGRTVTVNWTRTGGSATPGVGNDFMLPGNANTGTLTFPPLTRSVFLPVFVNNDSLAESDETVVLQLGSPNNATLGLLNPQTFTILDNDVSISWGVPHRQTNVVEGSSGPNRFSLPIMLSRVMSQELTVAVAERTVVPGVDYTRVSPQPLRIPAGQTQTTFSIDINGDTEDELDENVFFALTNSNFGTISGGAEFHVTIIDDDAPGIEATFGFASQTVTEANTSVFIDVYLSAPADRPIWVSFNTNGTAHPGEDYNLFGFNPRVVAFSTGETAQQIRIDLLNDAVWEGQETLTLQLNGYNGAVPGTITNFTLRINDSLPAPTASFGNFSTSFQEAITSPSMPVQLSVPTAIPVKVNVAVTGGTATGGVDYTLNSGTVYFQPGETTKNVNLTCVNDALDELDETITLSLSPGSPITFPPDGYAPIGVAGITSRTFTIADDDTPPTASIQQFYFLLSEGQSTNATIRLTKPSGLTVSLNVEQVGGNASPADIQINPTSLTFQPGETQKVVTVTALNDTLVEGDEGFALTMTSANGVVLGSAREFYIRDLDGTRVAPEDATAEGFNPGHRVRFRKAADGLTITSVNDAEYLLALPLPDAKVAFEVSDDGVAAINYIDAATDVPPQGYFESDRDFHSVPGSPTFAAGNIDHFAMSASGYLYVPFAGNWNFTVRSDDGFRLRIGSNNLVVSEYANGRGPGDTVAVVDFPQPGYYRYELTYFEWAGGAQVEFLAQAPFLGSGNQLVGSGEDSLLVFRDLDIPPVVRPMREPFIPGGAGHQVEFRKASFNVTEVPVAQSLLGLPVGDARVLAVASDNGVSVINYDDASGGTGLFPGDRQIATPPMVANKGSFSAGAEDNFAMRASGFIQVTNPGVWSFVVNSDDGFQLRLGTNLQVISAFVDPRAPAATTNRVNLPVAGYYPFELIFFEWGGGALVEFFAFGPGQPTPTLVGDASGVLRVYQTGTTDVRLTVAGNGNQAILRWPSAAAGFTLERCSALAGASTVWTPVPGSPALVGQFWQQTDNIGGAARCYRLRK